MMLLRILILVLFCYDLVICDTSGVCSCTCQGSLNGSSDGGNVSCTDTKCCGNRSVEVEGALSTTTELQETTSTQPEEIENQTESIATDNSQLDEGNLVIVYPNHISGIPKQRSFFNYSQRLSVRSYSADENVIVVYPEPVTENMVHLQTREHEVQTTEIPETATEIPKTVTEAPEITTETPETTTGQHLEDEFDSVKIAHSSKVFQSVPTTLSNLDDFLSEQISKDIPQTNLKTKEILSSHQTNQTLTETEPNPESIENIPELVVKTTLSLQDIKIRRQNQFKEFLKRKSNDMTIKPTAEKLATVSSPLPSVNIRKNLLDSMNRRVPFLKKFAKISVSKKEDDEQDKSKEKLKLKQNELNTSTTVSSVDIKAMRSSKVKLWRYRSRTLQPKNTDEATAATVDEKLE